MNTASTNNDHILARMKADAADRFNQLKEDLKTTGIVGLAVVSAAPVIKVGAAAAALSQVAPGIDSHIVTISDIVNSYGVGAAGVATAMAAVALAHYAPKIKQWAAEKIAGAAQFFRKEDAKASLFSGFRKPLEERPVIAGADAVYKQMSYAGVLVDHNDNVVEYNAGDIRVDVGDRVMMVSPDVANAMLDLEDRAANRMPGDRFEAAPEQEEILSRQLPLMS